MSVNIEKSREPKHSSILIGIDRIRDAKKAVNALLNDVMGSSEPEGPVPSETKGYPCLSVVLNSSGDEIAGLAEEIIGLTNDLRREIL